MVIFNSYVSLPEGISMVTKLAIFKGRIPAMDEAFPVGHRQLRPTAGATQDVEMQMGMVRDGDDHSTHP